MERFRSPEQRSVVIVQARPDDARDIVRVQAQTWLATYPSAEHGITSEDILAKNINSPARINKWKSWIEQQGVHHMIWVAKDIDQLVGFCFAQQDLEEGKIEALYVAPNQQRSGTGKRLMDQAITWLGDARPIALSVATYNQSAIAFYQQLGFEISEDAPDSIPPLPSGKKIPVFTMRRASRKTE